VTSLCAPPLDAGWPLQCTAAMGLLSLTEPAGDLAAVPIDGGFLIAVVAPRAANVSDAPLAFLLSQDGGFWEGQGDGVSTVAATNSVALAPPSGASPATLLAGVQNTFDGTVDQLVCAAPFSGSGTGPFQFFDSMGNAAVVDEVRLARGPDGTLAFVVADLEGQGYPVGWGLGSAGGGCPSSSSALPALTGPLAAATPNDSAIAPYGSGQFVIAEAYANFAAGNDVVALFSVPSGSAIATPATFGFGAAPQVAVASDGTHVAVLASDINAGVLLFGLDGGALQPLATLSTATGSALSATSCGEDCALLGWTETSTSSAGTSFTPKYAVVNGAGCGAVTSFPSFTGSAPAPVVVADAPGVAVFVYGDNSGGAYQLEAALCIP
jgi:hypothetical protein